MLLSHLWIWTNYNTMPELDDTYYERKDMSFINKYFIDPSEKEAIKKMENRKIMEEGKRVTGHFQRLGMLTYPDNYIKFPE